MIRMVTKSIPYPENIAMYNHVRSHLLLIAFVLTSSQAALPAQKKSAIEQLVKQITKKRNTKPRRAQEELLELVRHEQQLSASKLATIVTALEKEGTFPFLNQHSAVIDTALYLFDSTPGFNKTLQTFLINIAKPDQAKGFLYEMQKGVQISQKNDETMEAFAQEVCMDAASPTREFDIFTDKRWIECKDVNWPAKRLNTPATRKTQQQFLDQKRITDQFNEYNNANIAFEVHSKRPLSDPWRQWFADNKITCKEEESE